MSSDFADPLVAAGVVKLGGVFASEAATPVDALAVYLGRIERFNPSLNAFLAIDREGAMRDAEASARRWSKGIPRSPLDGVPIGVKVNIAVEGMPWHAGIAAYGDRVAEGDADCVARLRDAGAVILGMLNMHEAALGATTDNVAFGRCHNPHRRDFTPGGSSGGSASAVAAGLCAAALGTDTLGSVRIPAAYCGVFGHKPSHGAVSTVGVVPLSPTLDDVGVLARSAGDCRAVIQALAPRMVEQRKRPGRCSVFGLSGAADEPLSAAVDAARRAGIEVQTVEATWDAAALRRLCLLIVEVEALAEHSGVLTKNPDGFSPPLRSLLAWAARQAAPKVAQAYRDLAAAASGLREHLRPFDAVLTPATPGPAFSFDDAPPINQADFTMLANIAGFAATAFPVGATPDGLPLSLQVISESDETALDLAERLALPAPTPPAFRA